VRERMAGEAAGEAIAEDRERAMKGEMARRVKAFVDQHGRRPQLAEISSDADWKALYDALNALRTRDGKPTNIKASAGAAVKKGAVVRLDLPDPLPAVPAGVKDGKPADGEAAGEAMALPAALHLCFPDLFPTMTCAVHRVLSVHASARIQAHAHVCAGACALVWLTMCACVRACVCVPVCVRVRACIYYSAGQQGGAGTRGSIECPPLGTRTLRARPVASKWSRSWARS